MLVAAADGGAGGRQGGGGFTATGAVALRERRLEGEELQTSSFEELIAKLGS